MKRAFSLVSVLVLTVLISFLLLSALKFSSLSVKESKNLYFREKAELFLRNSVELSLLAISGYDRGAKLNCLQKIKIISKDKLFVADINITKYYLFDGSDEISYCKNAKAIKSEKSHAMAVLNITVRNNPENGKIKEKILLTKRTVQKI